ncbi:hypothetical protein IKS57_01980, partial [bacterium]|nr:hypothetical protein [bacterium]
MIDMYFYETDVLTPTQLNQIENKIEQAKADLITMGFGIPAYQKTTWSLTSYLLAKYLVNIENVLKEIADIKGTDIETRTWSLNGKESFSYKDLNRWIKAYNLAYQELGQYYLASFTNFTTIENIKSKKLINLQLYGNIEQNGTPTQNAPVPINVVTGGQEINVASKNVFKIGYAVGKTISSHLPTNDNANPIVDNYDNNNISFHTATGSSNYVITLLNTFQLKPNTQYILSYTRTNTLSSGASARRYIYDVDDNWNYSVNNSKTTGDSGNQTQTFTTSSSGKIALAFGFYTNSSINSSEVNNIMIRLATETDDTYEPYNGKTYEINLGKNLFDGTYTNAVIGGTTGTIFAFASNTRTAIVKVEPNTTYTIKKYQGTGLGNR